MFTDNNLSQHEPVDELLFRWSPKHSKLLRDFWEDYTLVMETLEENQASAAPSVNTTMVLTTANAVL